MKVEVKLDGLKEAVRALGEAFPKDPKRQAKLLNQSMSQAAKNTIVPEAKINALAGDGSGALSESIGIRTQSRGKVRAKGAAAGVSVLPVRQNKKAMAMYIEHYYTRKGRAFPAKMFASGIRHGHLVEFGTRHSGAKPFLWPAAQSKFNSYMSRFTSDLRVKIERAVKRARKK